MPPRALLDRALRAVAVGVSAMPGGSVATGTAASGVSAPGAAAEAANTVTERGGRRMRVTVVPAESGPSRTWISRYGVG